MRARQVSPAAVPGEGSQVGASRGGVTIRPRSGSRAAARSCPPRPHYIPGAARPGRLRAAQLWWRSRAGGSLLGHRRELGAFSSLSGPPRVNPRPRQRRGWRWRPRKVPVLLPTLQRRGRREPPRDRHSPAARSAPEPAGTVVPPRA